MSSPSSLNEPLFFERIFVEKRWGGGRLPILLNDNPPFSGPVGESWEVSDVPGQETPIMGGLYEGKLLHQLVESHREDLLGESKLDPRGRFPILVKFLEAEDSLSLQVHPPDGPLSPNGVGKDEAWGFLEVSADASVICGLEEDTDLEDFRAACLEVPINEKLLRSMLREVAVKPGDLLPVESGTVHAVSPGVVLCEFQQTNDVTFRIYDWGASDLDGSPRETHIEEALAAIDPRLKPTVRPDFSSPHFSLTKEVLSSEKALSQLPRARVAAVLEGDGSLAWETGSRGIGKGSVFVLPAAIGEVRVEPLGDSIMFLLGEAC